MNHYLWRWIPLGFLGLALTLLGINSSVSLEEKGKVVLFLSTDCPVAAAYSPRLNNLFKEYDRKGIRFLAYFPNEGDDAIKVRNYSVERGLAFECLVDQGGVHASLMGIQVIPSVVVFDSHGKRVYFGAIDDHKSSDLVKNHYLKEALDAVLAGRTPRVAEFEPFGCLLMAAKADSKDRLVTYSGDVAPLIYKRCTPCHRPGEVAPFSLTSYDDARKWSKNIARVARKRIMPPWKAVAGFGEFEYENRLSEEEIVLLEAWAEAGAPRGDATREPSPPTFSSDWPLGKPDMIIKIPRPYEIAAEGRDDYRNFPIPTSFTESKWITAMDVRPGNRRVVHHVIAFLDHRGRALQREKQTIDGQPGYSTFGGIGFAPDGALGGWAPGLRARHLPKDAAFELKPGSTIVLQIHYNKSGKVETDQTEIALYFAKEPPKRKVELAWLANPVFRIPAGEKNHKVRFEFRLPMDVTTYAAMPHMHLLGKEMKAWVVRPDGKEVPLIWVTDWDFKWQMTYSFKTPLSLPRGSVIHIEAIYDNSADNPNNPHSPPKAVTWGEQTTDEMFLLVVPYSLDNPVASQLLDRLSQMRKRASVLR